MNTRPTPAYLALGLLLILLIALPLGGVLTTLLQDTEAIPLSRSSSELLSTSLILALSVTLLTTVLGTLSGMGLLFLPHGLRYVILYLAMTAFLVPAYIYASAWIELTTYLPGINSRHLFTLPGTIAILTLTHYPIITCAAYIACTRIEEEKLEIARMEGSLLSILRHVMFPHALPFIATGSLIVYLLSLTHYTLPALFQVTTYPIEIFTLYNAFHSPANGIRLVLPIIALALAAIILWWFLIGHHLSHSSFHAPKKVQLPTSRLAHRIILVSIGALLLLSVGLPLGTLFLKTVSLEHLREVWANSQDEWITSLSLALGTTLIILCISSLGTFLCDTLPRTISLSLILFLCLPYLISGPAWGIGLIKFWNHVGLRGDIYDHPLIAYLACTGKYLFIGWLGFTFALRSVRPEYTDAARVFGVPRWQQFITIILPLTAPYAMVVGAILFLLVLGEVDSLLLVSPPGFTTIPVRIYGLMHYGPSPLVSAMALLMVLVIGGITTALCIPAAWLLHKRKSAA